MHLAYFDESGDDGFPSYSSPLFVLTALYLHYLNWKATLEQIHDFRRRLRSAAGLPVRLEMHTRQFLLGKRPYRDLLIGEADRAQVIDTFCDLVAALDLQIVNVVIVKPRILKRDYNVLDWAVKAAVQRIENDLKPAVHAENRFLVITDPGRVGKMRATTRRLQRVNFIPSKFGPTQYRAEIRSLIEDPLPKDSKESYFIQLADLVAYIVYLHSLAAMGGGSFPNRLPGEVDTARVDQWL